ncbi:TPA: 5-(carboxyamino)imidazole ribonucleotide mutase [candidate division WOR-3 bacterium]|jgi:phosphoribosylaminoimidazole carboxylase PurE protein|uniref:N5-carboxyaminoimidazole ribonucleotide mutase n=1 Tax=candidate division WOR-3 bacterium TaxID=2052148 RepID=A0A350H7T4_UNCW3|nr:5-(carboxyamino)imidazole ribonucleotide mutase [candidate division WOR-3 bacterium]
MQGKIAILMGSESDRETMSSAETTLKEFGIECDVLIMSAHRNPDKVKEFSSKARENGYKAIICGAGYAAHLAGVVASHTTLPVLAVPIDSSSLKGIDSLYASVMMPSGIPVAVFTIGKTGAKNAAIFAVEMFAVSDSETESRLKKMRDGWN